MKTCLSRELYTREIFTRFIVISAASSLQSHFSDYCVNLIWGISSPTAPGPIPGSYMNVRDTNDIRSRRSGFRSKFFLGDLGTGSVTIISWTPTMKRCYWGSLKPKRFS